MEKILVAVCLKEEYIDFEGLCSLAFSKAQEIGDLVSQLIIPPQFAAVFVHEPDGRREVGFERIGISDHLDGSRHTLVFYFAGDNLKSVHAGPDGNLRVRGQITTSTKRKTD